ncbi:MAG: divergent polysaccharide deacetylase family protein [bacterium]
MGYRIERRRRKRRRILFFTSICLIAVGAAAGGIARLLNPSPNYEKIAENLRASIDERIDDLGVVKIYLDESETLEEGGAKWVHISKEIEIPENFLIDEYKDSIVRTAEGSGARILYTSESSVGNFRVVRIGVGMEGVPMYSLGIRQPLPPSPHPHPRVAIIIDDVGTKTALLNEFLDLNIELTFSVLPFGELSEEAANEIHRRGKEAILHLPMEPRNLFLNPGPGAITTRMEKEEIERRVDEALKQVPYAVGANNHMGSAATTDEGTMFLVLSKLKEHGLFFVDSKTSPNSVAYTMAKKFQMRAGVNRFFLDSFVNDAEYTKGRLRKLIEVALRDGAAIAIGHPRSGTAQAIREMIPEFLEKGIEFVRVSELVN